MKALEQYKTAKQRYDEAKNVADMIGMQELSTAGGKGKLHIIQVRATVHYQPTDGAKNYHESEALNAALSIIACKHWDTMLVEALAVLKDQVDQKRDAASAEYKAEFEAV